MAHLEESAASSAAMENLGLDYLGLDFKSMKDVERATTWNRETVISHP